MSTPIIHTFPIIEELVTYLRDDLKEHPNSKDYKYVLLFAYNGTGKTRLSMEFKEAGKKETERDTLYFNAFTEDLFHWDNDLEGDNERVLTMNAHSKFFPDLESLEIEDKIRKFLHRYVDFNFSIKIEDGIDIVTGKEIKYRTVNFNREALIDGTMRTIDNIKISRGEESIFIWCFFLAIAQLAIDEHEEYKWVKYLYIDDPISSLDDNNAIYVASHLAQLLKDSNNKLKVIISSHHSLFYNVMWNELNEKGKLKPYFLNKVKETNEYTLQYTKETPFFHHVAIIKELHQAVESGKLYAYHFNVLRNIMEKTSTFLGLKKFSDCIQSASDEEEIIYSRMINILSHGNYSLFEPKEMVDENKEHFRKIFNNFINKYHFNPELFPENITQESQS
ncbi:AAA family ATPase [Sulfuricurvum sp.]|uniref:AAA family ATPase n=1 Tax=Sulfuricurvum sp. TaxID=2025608 RepID=UPI00356AD2EB